MLKGKKVVIFDMDGTLIDSIGIWNAIDEELIRTIGNRNIDDIDIGKQRDEKLKEYSKSEDAYLEYCNFLKEKYESNMKKEEIKKLRYQIADNYLKTVIDYKPEAEKVLKYLKQKSFTLVIASTTNDHTIEIYKNENKNIINKANIEDIFSLIYSKGAVKELKPNPEIHYKILKELKVTKEECLIIEDSLVGVEAANNANIEVAVIYDKYSDCNREEINKLSQYQFKDYNEMLNYIMKEVNDVELWEVLDEEGNLTGEIMEKYDQKVFDRGGYHLGSDVWIINSDNKILIQKRSACKRLAANVWAMTGGSVIFGENSVDTIVREAKEELDIDINPNNLKFLTKFKTGNVWIDTYVLKSDYDISKMKFKEDEVSDVKWATYEEIEDLVNKERFIKHRWEFVGGLLKEELTN